MALALEALGGVALGWRGGLPWQPQVGRPPLWQLLFRYILEGVGCRRVENFLDLVCAGRVAEQSVHGHLRGGRPRVDG